MRQHQQAFKGDQMKIHHWNRVVGQNERAVDDLITVRESCPTDTGGYFLAGAVSTMFEIGSAAGVGAVVELLVISFCAFLIGTVFRKWPDKVLAYLETIDGSTQLLRAETQRTLTGICGLALIVLSFAALLAAGYLLR